MTVRLKLPLLPDRDSISPMDEDPKLLWHRIRLLVYVLAILVLGVAVLVGTLWIILGTRFPH